MLIEDPLQTGYCQSSDDLGPGSDSQIQVEEYKRTGEEKDNLGLIDMKTKLDRHGRYVRDTFLKMRSSRISLMVRGKRRLSRLILPGMWRSCLIVAFSVSSSDSDAALMTMTMT